MKLTAVIYDDNDAEIRVQGEHSPGSRGSRDKYGAPLEPDTFAEIEVTGAWDDRGDEYILNADEEEEAVEALWERVEHE